MIVVRGFAKILGGLVVIEARAEDLWGDLSLPRDSRTTGLAVSTPHGCVVVIGVDVVMAGERALLASFLDPLDPSTLEIVEAASKTRRIEVVSGGRRIGSLGLSDEDLGKMEYVAAKTRECSKMQDRPVDLEPAAQWFIESFS